MSEAIRWCGVTLTMNAPYLDPDDVAAARARLALTDDDLAVLARVRGLERSGGTVHDDAHAIELEAAGELLSYLTGDTQ